MNIDWKEWKNHGYWEENIVDNQVKLYKSLLSLYNINSKNMSLLEIGAGHGNFTLVFNKLFKKITAIDSEESLIYMLNNKILELNLTSKIETEVTGCENYITKKKFNFIAFTHSFMWINDKQKCLLNLSKLLTKNGYILLIEPARFVNDLDKKFTKQKQLMIDTLQTFFSSKKLNLVHFLNQNRCNIYLFKKN
tara:strand:+ start:1487 stop:2065 length:579 start_codon:yes stop_codon:yes gene_type:complete